MISSTEYVERRVLKKVKDRMEDLHGERTRKEK